ncbi:metallophosphoesterase [Bradyrhizobium sp. S3.9.1]|uniref:metallophosphoesterase n=1 Tax=Bradyrhizobium sp. S3.9.1 TaxID=3156431 RepID=UPI003395FEC8
MRLWIMSDLHLESAPGWDLPPPDERPCFDVLVVAGDLVPGMERGVAWLAERVVDRPVIYVAGNHELYGRDIDRTVSKARQVAAGSNVHVLQNETVTIGGVVFVGATLWTDFALFGNPDLAMRRAADLMNDYRRIRKLRHTRRLRPVDTLVRHIESKRFIASAADGPKPGPMVVVSHHGCVKEAMKVGSETDVLSAAYTSDCPELLDDIDLWIYGHTHEYRDFTVGRTRIVSNAKGYGPWRPGERWDNPNFDLNLVIEI